MSNAVFPTLAGLNFPVKKTPIWSTSVKTAASGREARASFWSYPRWKYSLGYDLLRSDTNAELQQLVGFFNARQGSFDDWLFDDPDDNAVVGQTIAVADGVATSYQLTRSYGGFAEPVTAPKYPDAIAVGISTGAGISNKLAPYSDFEGDADSNGLADGWTAYSSGSVSGAGYAISTDAATSSKSQQISASSLGTAVSDRVGLYRTVGAFVAPSGTPACLSVYAKLVSGSAKVTLYLEYLDASGITISGSMATVTATGSFVRFSVSGTVPAGTANATAWIWAEQGNGGAVTIRVDAAQFEFKAAPTGYANIGALVSASGVVTLPGALSAGIGINWTGGFYRRCRFAEDQIELEKFMAKLWSLGKLEFLSVK